MIGRTVSRFRILAPLGTGGMASVWRAHDELLGRDLALKILSETLAQSEDARRRFRHEANIAAQLDHPAIAAVYDSGEHDGSTWIAMALIEGETLAERLARSLVPVAEVVSIAISVAEALGYAHTHERAVVHRDVTSRNVMLARDGRVFVLDFGLALAQGSSRVSSSGTMVGTAPYMAPELVLGAQASPVTDLYGLGVVMYEALTGTVPFSSERPAALVLARLNQAAQSPRELRPETPASLDRIVLRCLEREPGARFAAAAELIVALRAVKAELQGIPIEAPEAGPGAEPAARTRDSDARTRSFTAERLALRGGVAYLAVPDFEVHDRDANTQRETRDIAHGMSVAAAAAAGKLQRLHVVPADAGPPDRSSDALRAYARGLGANLLLLGDLRRSGTRLRVTYDLRDPEASLQVHGDALEGSSLDPFELEDRLLASLRRALARDGVDSEAVTRERRRDPVAAEHFRQALKYLERHDQESSVDAAIDLLDRLIQSEGDVAAYHAALGRACLFKHNLTRQRTWEARAATAVDRAIQLAPDAPETLLAAGDLHRIGGRHDEAEREYGLVLAMRADDYEARIGRARTLDALGRISEAEQEFLIAIEARPDDWRAHILLGLLRFGHGRYREALAPWQRVLELVPDHALAARNLGSAYFHLDRFEEAIASYRRSLDYHISADAYRDLGTAYFFVGRYQDSEDAFEKCVALTPGNPFNWGNLGSALRLIPGRQGRAVEALERAVGLMRERLERSPGEADAWARMAGWLANLGKHDEAQQLIEHALNHWPEDVRTQVSAGHVYFQAGKRAESLRWFGEALRRGYGPEGLLRSPEIAPLLDDPAFKELLSRPPGHTGQSRPGLSGREENP